MRRSTAIFALLLTLTSGLAIAQEGAAESREQSERELYQARQIEELERQRQQQKAEQARREEALRRQRQQQQIQQQRRQQNSTSDRPTPGRPYEDRADNLSFLDKLTEMMWTLQSKMQTLRAKQRSWDEGSEAQPSPEERMHVRREMEATEDQITKLRAQREAIERRPRPEAERTPQPGALPGLGEGDGDERVRRIRHMRVAAEHLRAAGMHDLAATVMGKVEAHERELREQQRPRTFSPDRAEIDALRRELQQLREEVRKLRADEPQPRQQPRSY